MTVSPREVCDQCERENPLGFDVPDRIWDAATDCFAGVLCIICFDEQATGRSVQWDREIVFWPVSGMTVKALLPDLC